MGQTRVWLERFGVALFAFVALGVPLILGLVFYLAVVEDGITVNNGNPLAEQRMWMTRERRRLTGIGLQLTSAARAEAAASENQCALTNVFFLKWDGALRVETAPYCKCYQPRGQNLLETNAVCAR